MLNNGDEEEGMTRFNPKDLVFDLVELDDEGNEVTYLVDALSYNDFNNRRIWVNTVLRETSLMVNKTYKLRMWLSDKVLISDTFFGANYPSTGYENHYASVKVSVYGDFIEKQTPYNYMARLGTVSNFWGRAISSRRGKITSVNFISMSQEEIDVRYDNSSIKEDLSDTSNGGSVKAWLENDESNSGYYTMYVASEGTTFFTSDCSFMFIDFSNLESFSFENVNTRNVNNMSYTFQNCSSLKSLDLSNFDTSKVTNMYQMFYNCSSLKSLNLSNFDTSSVTNMVCMFRDCTSLITLDLSNWNTSSVTSMSAMFINCGNITTIYSNTDWNTSNVTNSPEMFGGCTNLVGAIAYDSSKTDVTYANPTTGYFTKKTA